MVVIFLVNLNTLHSAATFLQIFYSEATWLDMYCKRMCRQFEKVFKVVIYKVGDDVSVLPPDPSTGAASAGAETAPTGAGAGVGG